MMGKGQETEKKILNAALELFFKKGYSATSISEITSSVGITKGSLYSHFKSKSELLHRLLYEYENKFLNELKKQISDHEGDAISKLHLALSIHARAGKENLYLCALINIIGQEIKVHDEFEYDVKKLYHEREKLFTDLIKQGIRQGLINKELDPHLTALAFMGLNYGIHRHWILNNYSLDGPELVKTMRTVFFEGITTNSD